MKGTIFSLVLVFVVCAMCIGTFLETHYTTNGVIQSVNGELVTVEDEQGNLWDFYGTGFKEGKEVKIKFYNNGTEYDIYDDQITGVS